jgi:hypothetical protein
MRDGSGAIAAPLARWSSRLGLFSVSLIFVGIGLHRLASFPTPAAVNLFAVGFALAALGAVAGLIALVQIWRHGFAGAGSAVAGVLIALGLFAWPLAYVPKFMTLPVINDVSTDLNTPPRFLVLAKQRAEAGSPAVYPGERFAREQQKAYPDLRPFWVDRSVIESFELVAEAVRRLRWKVVSADPPSLRPQKPGLLEASEQTLILGFTDDIVIRVDGGANRSRIDIRSASRYGSFDLGQNAERVRRFMAELKARLDSTVPTGIAGRRGLRAGRLGKLLSKRPKDRDQPSAATRSAQDRARASAQRGRAPKD